jgi:membrane fusion protein, multidrug efflux system
MKKLIAILLTIGVLTACNSGNDEQAIRDKIDSYEQEVKSLNNKIKELESQLADADDPANGNFTKVTVMNVKRQPFSKYFLATGELEALQEAYISPEVSGQITNIPVEEGEKVKKGQLLAKLNTSIVEKNIEEVKTQLELAETLYKKQSELWDQGIGSERQYLETKNNYENLKNRLALLREQYKMSIITSPIDGYVENIILKQGELASPGMQLMLIVNLDKLKVASKISEAYLPIVKEGEEVVVTFPTFPDLRFEKPISRISNVVNKQNRTFLVEVMIDNPDGVLKPNLLANVEINVYSSDTSIVIPSMIVREDLKGTYLYVATKNGDHLVSKKKYIQLGKAYKDKTEVLSGIEVGEQIIIDGYSNVSDGSYIDVVG